MVNPTASRYQGPREPEKKTVKYHAVFEAMLLIGTYATEAERNKIIKQWLCVYVKEHTRDMIGFEP